MGLVGHIAMKEFHILVDNDTMRTRIIDFDVAAHIYHYDNTAHPPWDKGYLTLGYTAPEVLYFFLFRT